MAPRSATCGRSSGSRSSWRRGESGASSITGGLGVQQRRSKRGKKLGNCLECLLFSRHRSRPGAESWLVVARGASAPLRLVGHLGWVHQQEARAVGRPRERMMPLREALTPRRDRAGLARKTRSAKGGVRIRYIIYPPGPSASWRRRSSIVGCACGRRRPPRVPLPPNDPSRHEGSTCSEVNFFERGSLESVLREILG